MSKLFVSLLTLTVALTLLLAGAGVAGAMGSSLQPGSMPQGSGAMMPQDPGTMMPDDPGTMMPQDPGTMMPQDPGTMMPQDPGAMMPQDPGTMMPDDPGTMMPQDPGTMMPEQPGMMPGPGSGSGQQHMFPDAAGSWFEGYADHMAENGFMGGFVDGSFGGERPITRGQFAAIMARMMDVPSTGGAPFSDTAGFWGAGYVGAMAEMGVIKGHEDGSFGPYDPVTRAQMAAMMDRAWEYMNGTSGMTAEEMEQLREEMRQLMPDGAGHWAEDHIAHMYDIGVVQGDGQGHFNPDYLANRAQASAMMWRWYELSNQG